MSDAEFAELLKASDRDPLALARCFVAMYGDDPAKAGEEDEFAAAPVALAVHVIAQAEELQALRRAATGCPCRHTTPCSDMCSCAHPLMSAGCQRCALYGSDEQRQGAARRLAAQAEELARLRRENGGLLARLDDMIETVADRGQLIGDRMKLRAALREALDGWEVEATSTTVEERIVPLRRLADGE